MKTWNGAEEFCPCAGAYADLMRSNDSLSESGVSAQKGFPSFPPDGACNTEDAVAAATPDGSPGLTTGLTDEFIPDPERDIYRHLKAWR
jgi:hypothetical protein